MNFGPTTYGLGLLAGTLSTLSSCVLPLVPVLLAAAMSAHRWGAVALGAGLALSVMPLPPMRRSYGVVRPTAHSRRRYSPSPGSTEDDRTRLESKRVR
jgi:hypothetical protein